MSAPRVLIVDDERMLVEMIMRGLRRRQGEWDIVVTSDSSFARALVDADAVDVLVTDLQMPPPDGIEIIRRARRDGRELQIIVITGGELPDALASAVERVLYKPVLIKTLEAAIASVLSASTSTST